MYIVLQIFIYFNLKTRQKEKYCLSNCIEMERSSDDYANLEVSITLVPLTPKVCSIGSWFVPLACRVIAENKLFCQQKVMILIIYTRTCHHH